MTAKDRALQVVRRRTISLTDAEYREVRRLAEERHGPKPNIKCQVWLRLIEEVRSRRRGAAGNGDWQGLAASTSSAAPPATAPPTPSSPTRQTKLEGVA